MPIELHPATIDDLSALEMLWRERLTILSQVDRRFLDVLGQEPRWRSEIVQRIESSTASVIVAGENSRTIGYITGVFIQGEPVAYGVIDEIALDAHGYHPGLGRGMVESIKAWFDDHGAVQIYAVVPRHSAVEQAFWRSLGAMEMAEIEWMKIKWNGSPERVLMRL